MKEASRQPDLFGESGAVLEPVKRVADYGRRDALCGLPLQNYYSDRISGERRVAYESAWRAERARIDGHYDGCRRKS